MARIPTIARRTNRRRTGMDQPAQMGCGSERFWTSMPHLSAPIAFVISAGSLSIIGPLIIYLVFKDRSPTVRQAAAGAFNFNLAFWLLYVVGATLVFTSIGIPIALILWTIIFVVAAICHLIGGQKVQTMSRTGTRSNCQ